MKSGYAVKNNGIKLSESNQKQNKKQFSKFNERYLERGLEKPKWGMFIVAVAAAVVVMGYMTTIF